LSTVPHRVVDQAGSPPTIPTCSAYSELHPRACPADRVDCLCDTGCNSSLLAGYFAPEPRPARSVSETADTDKQRPWESGDQCASLAGCPDHGPGVESPLCFRTAALREAPPGSVVAHDSPCSHSRKEMCPRRPGVFREEFPRDRQNKSDGWTPFACPFPVRAL